MALPMQGAEKLMKGVCTPGTELLAPGWSLAGPAAAEWLDASPMSD